MLCQFSFKNFKSFKDEAFLDLYAESISEMKNTLIVDSDKQKFLPVISIYGPNGGGKSTVLEAINHIRRRIYLPFMMLQQPASDSYFQESRNVFMHDAQNILSKEIYFKFDSNSLDSPTEFELLFRNNGTEYKYELSTHKGNIIHENLYCKNIGKQNARLLFERSDSKINTGKELEKLPLDKVKSTLPLLSYIAATYDIPIINDAIMWFGSIVVFNYNDPALDRLIQIPDDRNLQNKILSFLQDIDISITGIHLERDDNGRISRIYTSHTINGIDYRLSIEDESSGTKKLFSCILWIIESLTEGRLLIADELDAKLHPKIMRYIIELFKNKESNPNGAQLILTSHDMVNMNPDVFRRDEIWFCSQGLDHSSALYSLVSFNIDGHKVRKDEIYSKRYLEGKYGADPYIDNGLKWLQGET